MTPSISWASIDTNQGTKGYLDSTEVANAYKKGIKNVFVGMIQEDYEGTLDINKIKDKYDRGANGKLPIYGSMPDRNHLAQLYRELVILESKYNNLKEQCDKKYGIKDSVKNWLSQFRIFKENKEYTNDKANLENLENSIKLKIKELEDFISSAFYTTYNENNNSEPVSVTLLVSNRPVYYN